jgi:3-oxoacyl-(acyl-carrier-protein) synthase III
MIGLRQIPAFDIRGQCSGFLYALNTARAFVESNIYRHVLIVCAELLSKRMDCSDAGRNLSILLGDGAGAVVIGPNDGHGGLLDLELGADGHYFDLLFTRSPGSSNPVFIDAEALAQGFCHFRMRGSEMFAHASATLAKIAVNLLDKQNLRIDEIDLVICHQPNLRILDVVKKTLGLTDQQLPVNVESLGNMASASLPVTYAQAVECQAFRSGDLLLFLGYGAGATWGAALYQA